MVCTLYLPHSFSHYSVGNFNLSFYYTSPIPDVLLVFRGK